MADSVFMRRMNRMVVPPKRPAWLKRALNPNTPTTVARESIRTRSTGIGEGREILFPTIRMVKGKLVKYSPEEAEKIALKKKDFIEFNTPAEATTFSKGLSKYISQLRKGDN